MSRRPAPPRARKSTPQAQARPPRARIDPQLLLDLVDAGSSQHYDDAALYDYEYRRRRDDVRFYVEAAQAWATDGRVLELGCGSGRLTLPLAKAGMTVTGLDRSPPMLARLAQHLANAPAAVAARVHSDRQDLRAFQVPGRYPLVIAAFNVLEHLYTRVELAACLASVRRALRPDGRLVFDVQMPDLAWLTRDPRRRWARTRFTHPVTGDALYYSTNHVYDPVSQIADIRLYYTPAAPPARGGKPRREQVVHLTQRKFFPAELEALLAHSGFVVEHHWGDFARQPLADGADSQVIVARPASRKR